MASKAVNKKVSETEEMRVPAKKRNRKYSLFVGGLIVLGVLYLLKGLFVVATVNGSPIFRYSVVKQLEKQGGSSVVDSLVTEKLVDQEAKNKGISVLPKEIDEEITRIEGELSAQGQELDQVLEMQGMTRQDLMKQIRLQKIVEKVFADQISVTDEEVTNYLETYGSSLSEELSEEEKKAVAVEQLKQQKLAESFYGWIDGLRSSAKINYLINY